MRSTIVKIGLGFAFLLLHLGAHAQINPANQINWPTGSAGCVYAPGTNTCVANGGAAGLSSCADTSGSGTAQSCTTSPSFTPAANSCIAYSTTTTNSGTGLTINVNSLSAKSAAIPSSGGWTTTLTASILPANKPLIACYDGTHWNVQQTGTASSASGVASINGNTGAQTLESLDSSVAITEPDGSHIDLSATGGGGGGIPAGSALILLGTSGPYDDNNVLSSAVPVASASLSAGTVTVITTGAHHLVSGDYVDVHGITGWPNANQEPFFGSFKVLSAGLTSTQFEFSFSGSFTTCSSSCGNVYNADYWGIYQIANQPNLKGKVTMYGIETSLANADTNFSSLVPSCSLGSGGAPTFLLIYGGQNDLSAGATDTAIEQSLTGNGGADLGIWPQAHSAGCIVVQGTIGVANYGGSVPSSVWTYNALVNRWIPNQSKSFANTASGAYWDREIDYASWLYDSATFHGGGQVLGNDPGAAYNFAQRTNAAFADQSSSVTGPPSLQGPGAGYILDYSFPYGGRWYMDNSANLWMHFGTDSISSEGIQLYNFFNNAHLQMYWPTLSTSGIACTSFIGKDSGTNNSFGQCYTHAGNNSTSNAFSMRPMGGSTDLFLVFANGTFQIPGLAGGSTVALCVDTSGNLSRTGCSPGSLDANTVSTPLFAAGGGTANAQTITLSPTIGSLSTGLHVRWVPSNANTGAATLAVNGLTAKSVTKCGTTALAAGDLALLTVADATYDGTQFQLSNPAATACAGGSPGVTSIDSQTGAFTFGGSGVSHTGNAYTFSGGGGSYQYSALALPPATTSFTWQNQGSATVVSTSVAAPLYFVVDSTSGQSWRLFTTTAALPTAPWAMEEHVSFTGMINSAPLSCAGAADAGLALYDGTKALDMETFCGAVQGLRVEELTNLTTDNTPVQAADVNYLARVLTSGVYLAWCVDASHYYAETSLDGVNWSVFYTQTPSFYLTPTSAGPSMFNQNTSFNQRVSVDGYVAPTTVGSCPL